MPKCNNKEFRTCKFRTFPPDQMPCHQCPDNSKYVKPISRYEPDWDKLQHNDIEFKEKERDRKEIERDRKRESVLETLKNMVTKVKEHKKEVKK